MTDLQQKILMVVRKYCSHDNGYGAGSIAGYVARQPYALTTQQHSAVILRELLELEKAGLVRRMDNKKPIIWCKV